MSIVLCGLPCHGLPPRKLPGLWVLTTSSLEDGRKFVRAAAVTSRSAKKALRIWMLVAVDEAFLVATFDDLCVVELAFRVARVVFVVFAVDEVFLVLVDEVVLLVDVDELRLVLVGSVLVTLVDDDELRLVLVVRVLVALVDDDELD